MTISYAAAAKLIHAVRQVTEHCSGADETEVEARALRGSLKRFAELRGARGTRGVQLCILHEVLNEFCVALPCRLEPADIEAITIGYTGEDDAPQKEKSQESMWSRLQQFDGMTMNDIKLLVLRTGMFIFYRTRRNRQWTHWTTLLTSCRTLQRNAIREKHI